MDWPTLITISVLCGVCGGLTAALVGINRQLREREKEWALERGALLQRIQAPEVAVREFADRPDPEPVIPVPVDDDVAYAEARKRRMNASGD